MEQPGPARPGSKIRLTDSGLETWLVFDCGLDLPEFAAFPLLETAAGRARLTDYWERHIAIALKHRLGFILGAPTWRANADWGAKLGYDAIGLDHINREAIGFMQAMRDTHETPSSPMPVQGSIGPRFDAYHPDTVMSADEAEAYHTAQIASFVAAGADGAAAMTVTHSSEAIGIVRAAQAAGLPCMISFTTETDGRLPGGQSLGEAIEAVDAATGAAAESFMINCAHPDHFRDILDGGEAWTRRITGLRANASRKSHAELDNSTELDPGDALKLAALYRDLRAKHPGLTLLGGCCGTDDRHIAAISEACV
ncbi:homocysteine S-methyltransferase family protein [Maricaulis sp.]|uniref:homocysteine S-methyltransferase family protein n=1 Tax=Maricaulis sp. TaxID=1486257 RepID=UPI003A95B373